MLLYNNFKFLKIVLLMSGTAGLRRTVITSSVIINYLYCIIFEKLSLKVAFFCCFVTEKLNFWFYCPITFAISSVNGCSRWYKNHPGNVMYIYCIILKISSLKCAFVCFAKEKHQYSIVYCTIKSDCPIIVHGWYSWHQEHSDYILTHYQEHLL